MTNPAKALYDILAAWKKASTSNGEVRRLGSQDGWEQQFRAIELLKDINQLITEAYSASAKTHLHQQAEKQKEHAIHLGLPYSQKLIRHREAE